MKSILFSIIMLVLAGTTFAQKDKMLDVLDDEMELMDNDNQTLRFFDSQDGEPVADATVTITDIGEYTTDEEGKIRFPNQPDGYLEVTFKKEGYITATFDVEIVAEMIFFNRFSMSPKMDIGHMRIVLDWDQTPADLDAHLVKENNYHISYRNTQVLSDGTGRLDRDDMDGYGPETITISDIDDNANYEYYVHNYSDRNNPNSNGLSKSKGTVKVFANNQFLGTVEIPLGPRGLEWSVFIIKNGEIEITNEVR
ncbi:MAG: carboxypeptidase regulatory-like domain-containing protein [Salinivirgaceae bacterium]|jgi:hypothetical protein|nr:carboxypeptidase regulatory-like domain-containing protein [Salinivirgaceae bacterium]